MVTGMLAGVMKPEASMVSLKSPVPRVSNVIRSIDGQAAIEDAEAVGNGGAGESVGPRLAGLGEASDVAHDDGQSIVARAAIDRIRALRAIDDSLPPSALMTSSPSVPVSVSPLLVPVIAMIIAPKLATQARLINMFGAASPSRATPARD